MESVFSEATKLKSQYSAVIYKLKFKRYKLQFPHYQLVTPVQNRTYDEAEGVTYLFTSDYHVHSYATRTSFAHGHIHFIAGTTGSGVPNGGPSHIHYYSGVTTIDDGHVHYYRGATGPAIYLPGGGHTHAYVGCTTIDFAHSHSYGGQTSSSEFAHLFNKAYN